MKALLTSAETATPSAPPCSVEYPATFTAELIEHCRQGCIPPEVFADARALLAAEQQRRRYVRVNPRCLQRVIDAGVENVRRLDSLSSASATASSLIDEERQQWHELQPCLYSVPSTGASGEEENRTSSPPSPSSLVRLGTEQIGARVPQSVLLRLGVARLTGLPLASVQPVLWLPCGVFALPWSYAMGSSPLFREGLLLAMDAASVAAVAALRPRPGERVLDLCCAPGMKLGLIADAVARPDRDRHPVDGATLLSQEGLAVGVDVSLPRLYTTRAMLKKQQGKCGGYAASPSSSLPVCLFMGDGRCATMADAVASMNDKAMADVSTGLTTRERRTLQRLSEHGGSKRPRRESVKAAAENTSTSSEASDSMAGMYVVYAPSEARASIAAWQQQQQQQQQQRHECETCPASAAWFFDRVLVDAECSHDGSVSHIQLEDGEAPVETSQVASVVRKGRGLTNEHRMQHLNLGTGPSAQSASADNTPSARAATFSSSSLFDVQSALLYNGYQQLKPGGTLVYATCSYAFTQDELVVRRFLDRVNTPEEKEKTATQTTAVLVPAFSFSHEEEPQDCGGGGSEGTQRHTISSCVCMESAAAEEGLQQLLDAHAADYGVVESGMRRYFPQETASPSVAVGSRFWPRTFSSSFLYVAKIWKKVG